MRARPERTEASAALPAEVSPADRWLAAAVPPAEIAGAADDHPVLAAESADADPELAVIGRAMVEAVTRLLVEREARERATGKRWALRMRPPRFDPHGEPEVVLSVTLELAE